MNKDTIDKIAYETREKSIYTATNGKQKAFIIAGDGRLLPEVPDDFFHAIITDHPWEDSKSNKGGNRHFDHSYAETSFQYLISDFQEKHRVLKPGCFLVENLPEENANNFEYLYRVKKLAEAAGFEYYAQVPWVKGTFVSNTGRKSKNSEMLVFFTKGKARNLRVDQKKKLKTQNLEFMSGTKYMLPVAFNFQPTPVKQKRHRAEKPIELLQSIIDHISLPEEVILDQFAGSMNIVKACLHSSRFCFAYEVNKQFVEDNLKFIEQEFTIKGVHDE
jgi:site-specific DNA-methyltransferase (adenine-specific)